MVSAAVNFTAHAAELAKSSLSAAPPSGFEQLEAERELVVDVYYGGELRGTAKVATYGDRVQILDPLLVVSFIPDAIAPQTLIDELGRPMAAHRSLACGLVSPQGCGSLGPATVGVILDEDRFRLDLFVASDLRVSTGHDVADFLARPEKEPGLVSLFGATLSGSTSGNRVFRLQNRSIASLGESRIRSDASIESGRGVEYDNLLFESDRKGLRFSAGQFWAPGTDLISRRKIIGVGLSTQFDTRKNKEAILGTPIEIFLNASSRVEVFVDGRLLSSQILPAGNRALDTSRWPSGSYDATIIVHEPGQAARSERRFFSRDALLAPVGHPVFQVLGGVYAGRSGLRDPVPFLQGSYGYRLDAKHAVQLTAIATKSKIIADLGSTLFTEKAVFSGGALVASDGHFGVVARGYTTAVPGISASFDLRRMWGDSGEPLLPSTGRAGTFDDFTTTSYDQASFLQLSGQLSARVAKATVRFSGYFRDSRGSRSSYSIGPSLEVPVVRRDRFTIVGEGDVRKSDFGYNGYAGFRLLLTEGSKSLSVRGGVSSDRISGRRFRGEMQGALYGNDDKGQWSANAAVGRDDDRGYARVAGDLRSKFINSRGEVLKYFQGDANYSLSAETGLLLTRSHAHLVAGDLKDSGILVSIDGSQDSKLDIYVNQNRVGTAEVAKPLLVYLDPYREFEVEARPHEADMVSTDFAPRLVTTYPGAITGVSWTAKKHFVGFGRLIDAAGHPLTMMKVEGPHGVAETDSEGYFQMDLQSSDDIRAHNETTGCAARIEAARPKNGYVNLGDVACM